MQTAVFEYNGSISILPTEAHRPLEPSDMDINPVQQEILVNVILDGNINEENLKCTGNNKIWLEKQLHHQGFHHANEIFLGAVNTVDNTLLLYAMEVENKTCDPFE